MSAEVWIAAGGVLVLIVVLAIWAAKDAARDASQPPTPLRDVLAMVGMVAWMLVLAMLIWALRGVYTLTGWLGAWAELRLRRTGALVAGDDRTILDDHGHPWDPDNTDWKDPWSTT